MKDRNSILIVADTHIPFEHPRYLDFCVDIYKRVKCKKVVHIGDLVDNHAISYHEHDPNGKSPIDEMNEADKSLKNWFKAFPEVYVCRGNHDLVDRKAKTVGLPDRVFRPFEQVWNFPKSWRHDFSFTINNVVFQHGTGYSGDNAHMNACIRNRQSTVIGHIHHLSTMGYTASEKDCIFGMAVGCGINRRTYAFEYGREMPKKPIVSCGVVTDNGEYCQVFKMKL